MNISNGSRTRSHVFIGLVAVALLLTLCGVLRADDDQKKKNKQSPQAQPAATPKPPKIKNSGSGTGSGSGSGQSGGTGSGSSSGNPNKAERRLERQNNTTTSNSSGGSGTSNSTNSNKAERKLHRQTDLGATGGSTSTGTGSGSGTGSGTGASSGKTYKNTGSNPAGGTGASTGNPNTSVTTTSTGSTRAAFVKSPNGKTEVFRARDGSEVHRSLDGRVREVHTHNMVITHYSSGYRRVVVERADRSVIVVNRSGYGYVQRPFYWHNQPYYGRTYYYYGRPYAVYYRSYPYHGLFLPGYAPYRYYNPAFYGWAYNPWYRPISYGWGWYGSPWYGYYGYYFTPYPVYSSPAFWLTDFLIASSLQLAYQERLQAQQQQYYSQPAPSGQVVLTPEVKQAISDEVQRQLALERAESETVARGGEVDVNATGLPRIFAETNPSHPHVFVVASPLEVTDSQGGECTLTQGDVLRLSYPPTGNATNAYLEVIASKNRECGRGATVSIGLADLQEMENQMRTTIDRGLQDLQAHQGGLPAPPASAVGRTVQASFATAAPPADQNISSELRQQAQQAQAAEQGVLTEAGQEDPDRGTSDASSRQPIQIQVGQTIDEVRAALGTPSRIATVGSKQIYFYPDMKVTFIRGRVTDVE